MVAIIGGEPHRFRTLVEMYREAGKRAGHGGFAVNGGSAFAWLRRGHD